MLVEGLRRVTRCAPCVRCARTDAASQFTKRAARASPTRASQRSPRRARTVGA